MVKQTSKRYKINFEDVRVEQVQKQTMISSALVCTWPVYGIKQFKISIIPKASRGYGICSQSGKPGMQCINGCIRERLTVRP